MIEVLPRIFIGPCHELEADAERFTHAVVAVNGQVPARVTSALPEGNVLHVDVEDVHDAMIVEYFAASSAHVRGALERDDARVAVVCAQGVSRSATLVLAYMMQYGKSREHVDGWQSTSEALNTLRVVYEDACPNDGFLQQLDIWREMGFKHDRANAKYRSLKVRQCAQNMDTLCQDVDAMTLRYPGNSEDGVEGAQGKDAPAGARGSVDSASISYRCRSCRQMLATSQNVMVDVSLGGEGFTWRKMKKNMAQSPPDAANSSVFVEPLPWMKGINDEAQGKIYCPNSSCNARLGSFNWSGMQNESSQWITPAFQLHLSKMDAFDPRDAVRKAASIDIRRPKLVENLSPMENAVSGMRPREATGSTLRAAEHAEPGTVSCVIFDCDGVLVDSERASCEALRRSILQVTQFDIPHAFPDDFVPVFGMDVRSCLEYYMKTYGQEETFRRAATSSPEGEGGQDSTPADGTANSPEDWMTALAARVADAKGPHYEYITKAGIEPIEGAAILMREACACVPTAIASSGSHAKIRHNLSSAGLWGIVPQDVIVSAQDVSRGKPAPDVYIRALESIGCQSTAEHAIVIEDSIHGIHAAIQAGVGHIAAMTTSLNEDQMMDSLQKLAGTVQSAPDASNTGISEGISTAAGVTDAGNRDGHAPSTQSVRPREVLIANSRCVVIGSSLPRFDELRSRFFGG